MRRNNIVVLGAIKDKKSKLTKKEKGYVASNKLINAKLLALEEKRERLRQLQYE